MAVWALFDSFGDIWQVNVVKGLKCYEDVFTESELAKLDGFVDDLRSAAKNGELSGSSLSFDSLSYYYFLSMEMKL